MRDLTTGRPVKQILLFLMPILIGNILQLTYSLVDTRVVGSVLGDTALAAVGATTSLSTMVIGFLQGLTNGFAVIIARFFGAGDYKGLKRSVAAAVTLAFGVSLTLTVFTIMFLQQILGVLHVGTDIYVMSYSYIVVIFAGMTVSMLYNLCAAMLRAIGDSVTPLIFLGISVVLNIFGDLLAICVFHMGVRLETGKQAKLLNEMVRLFSKDTPGLPEERLKEFVGHTPAQVLLGCLTGCVVAFLLNLLYV